MLTIKVIVHIHFYGAQTIEAEAMIGYTVIINWNL